MIHNKIKTMKSVKLLITTIAVLFCISCNSNKNTQTEKTAATALGIDRTILPVPSPEYRGEVDSFYTNSNPDWSPVQPINAPENAPNVIMIVLDDVGFGHLSSYGGMVNTPNIDKLAKDGLLFTNFHTTALCSPSRAALLAGKNHHQLGMAAITEGATGYPGNFGTIPKSSALISEVLKLNGYNTMALGKWHLTPYTAYTAAGPFTNWPLGSGFEKFYGFLGGETDQYAPLLVQDNSFIDIPQKENYHLSEDLVDKTLSNIKDQQQANTGRKFFTYLALGANHAPLHAPKSYVEKYKGKFNMGWDQAREEIFARQKQMKIIPENTKLPERNSLVKPWNSLNEKEKAVYCRLQEAYAGMLDHADAQIGKLIVELKTMGLYDNTMIMVVSDNGASQEGLQHGVTNTDRYRNYNPETVDEMFKRLDEIGSPSTDPLYPIGWSQVGNTPFKRWKQDTHSGGNTDPFIISWPARIKTPGIRSQYHHLVDVVPTILEAAGLPQPKMVNGVEQISYPGVSMLYTFDDANSKTKKEVQYYEMLGSRALWSNGWKAVCWHKQGDDFRKDVWELYHTDEDWSETNNLAASNPDKLKELQNLWWSEAKKYQVLPLDDRRYERAGDPNRPVAAQSKPVYTYYPNTSIVHPLAAPAMLGKKHRVTAFVEIQNANTNGVLMCTGGEFGGWSFFAKDGYLEYTSNYLQISEHHLKSNIKIPSGTHQLVFEFIPVSSTLKPTEFVGVVKLYIDDKQVGELSGVKTAANYCTMTGYGLQVGRNMGTAVTHEYKSPFSFNNKLNKVEVVIGK